MLAIQRKKKFGKWYAIRLGILLVIRFTVIGILEDISRIGLGLKH